MAVSSGAGAGEQIPISLYDVTIPVLIHGLRNLSAVLEKGRAFADAQGMDHQILLGARLAADMLPLTGQVQRASDTAKGLAVRLGQVPNVAMEDNETTFDALQARIAATISFIEAVPRHAIDGREEASIVLKLPSGDIPFTGQSYVVSFAIPNFFFHVTTAYAILRQQGVQIGKRDFHGG